MIIKSMSRKSPSFGQLSAYMLAPQGARLDLAHNLPAGAQTQTNIVKAFEENHACLPGRVNGNAMYHEIIALEPDTAARRKEQIAALRKLAARYLDQRAPQQLAVGVIHAETAHIHMHLMISSNAVLSKKRVWLTKKDFAAIQQDMEAYHLKHFPELGTAQHYSKASEGPKRSNREQAAQQRTGKASHNEELAATLKAILHNARSREALDAKLAKHGLTLYQRGRSVGIETEGGRRYRFGTLGLAGAYAEAMAHFELAESRISNLSKARSTLSHSSEQSF